MNANIKLEHAWLASAPSPFSICLWCDEREHFIFYTHFATVKKYTGFFLTGECPAPPPPGWGPGPTEIRVK